MTDVELEIIVEYSLHPITFRENFCCQKRQDLQEFSRKSSDFLFF